jgi:hypothetical protein
MPSSTRRTGATIPRSSPRADAEDADLALHAAGGADLPLLAALSRRWHWVRTSDPPRLARAPRDIVSRANWWYRLARGSVGKRTGPQGRSQRPAQRRRRPCLRRWARHLCPRPVGQPMPSTMMAI